MSKISQKREALKVHVAKKNEDLKTNKPRKSKSSHNMHQRKYYPVEDPHRPNKIKKSKHQLTKLRSSITPGTVLILVSTKHRGKRVVFLKQLQSGLLLVVGPYAVNGVPLMRVDQCHAIATSTRLDISHISVPERINDNYFINRKIEQKKLIKIEKSNVLIPRPAKSEKPPTEHIEDAKMIDKELLSVIRKSENMKKYLGTPFSLSNGQYPHNLVF